MIAAVYLPLWTLAAAFIVLCLIPDIARWVRSRVRAFRADRRVRAYYDELWSDEVGVDGGIGGVVSLGPRNHSAVDAGTYGDAA